MRSVYTVHRVFDMMLAQQVDMTGRYLTSARNKRRSFEHSGLVVSKQNSFHI